jgi:polysaccharide deacetylase family protein (PEP-CTERM system associated)
MVGRGGYEPSVEPGCAVLSFDVEEHFRIEAAAGLDIPRALRSQYRGRVAPAVDWLLGELDRRGQTATFFVVGELAAEQPAVVRAIQGAGHEVASHGWDHRRVLELTPETFREDLRRSKDALEQVLGGPVLGYRAPTFSITRRNPWAIDVLAEAGLLYDSSIYPVRHDRYGVPEAPRAPFVVEGLERSLVELPPATLRLGGYHLPAGGGGYFRLFPLSVVEGAMRQGQRDCSPPVAMLYFHPWEFDPDQPRLPLRRMSRWRTYVGVGRSRPRLSRLLARHRFVRAVDALGRIQSVRDGLPRFRLSPD